MIASRPFSIAIIGTGFSGLGMAIRLKQSGVEDFVLLERESDIGGTWRDNTYPGCACDVESHLYSFSFAPNAEWSRMFSGSREIWRYLRDCASRFGLEPHLRLRHELRLARWDSERKLWRLETSRGEIEARAVVMATGALSEPRVPDLPGLGTFIGKVMHSARWDHAYELSGKRIAVVGTGASAIQFVPEIQPRVERLHLFQRTAPWVIPLIDRPIRESERARFRRLPWLQKLSRLRIYLTREAMGLAFRHPSMMKQLERIAIRHMERAISDPALRRKLTPHYRIGCKRILLSNTYYPALARENVEVVTEEIAELRPTSVVTRDGRAREIDCLILGTGFHVTDMPIAERIMGREGRGLSELWRASPHAFLGTTVPGFPNLFFLLGPNTGLGHSSVVLMIESQIAHVLKALDYLKRREGIAIEPLPRAEREFNREVDEKMRRTVWVTGGCSSWYLDRTGRNSTLWPGSVGAFRRRVEPFHPRDYEELG